VPFFFIYSPTYFLADGKGNNYIFIPNYFFTSFLGVSAAFYGVSRRRAFRCKSSAVTPVGFPLQSLTQTTVSGGYDVLVFGKPTVFSMRLASSNLSGKSTFAASLSSILLILTIGVLDLFNSLTVITMQIYGFFLLIKNAL
jgi:hypothetical protein